MQYFPLFSGAVCSLFIAGMLLYVALSDVAALKRDKLGAALGIVAGGLFSALPSIVALQLFANSIK